MNREKSYFRFLQDPSLPIPYSTKYRRLERDANNPANDFDEAMVIEQDLRPVENNELDLNEQHRNDVENGMSEEELAEEHHANFDDAIIENEIFGEELPEAHHPSFNNHIVNNEENREMEDVDEAVRNIRLHQNPDNNYYVGEAGDEENEERIPIYPGASLTKEESDLLIMSFVIRHTLSDAALEDLLELINNHVPRTLNSSKYKFLKNFPVNANMKTFYYCPDCFILVEFRNNQQHTTCSSCDKLYLLNSLKRNGNFFLHMPLRQQLQNLLSGPLFNKLRFGIAVQEDTLSDITSGSIYKQLKERAIINDYDISIQWNADGVQTFKSSKVSMCPLQVSINELEYRTRKDNIILTGLWASSERPVLDLYLKPFVEELQDLHENGCECQPPGFEEPIIIKVHSIVAPVDSVERCALQNIHQYNGVYGCTFCLNPGESVVVGNGYSRIYRGPEGAKRSENQHTRDAIIAERDNKVVNGVKGVSCLMLLPIFNIIKSFPPEYMHSVLLGVVKLFLGTWLDSKNCRKLWYIGTKSKIINERLSKILPPCEITRVPQSVDNLKQWKASEFKNFLLYYSLPCLKDVLPLLFYKHWSLFVYAIHVFNAETITIQAYEKAARAMRQFVYNTELLYEKELMKYNVHLLLHIPDAVRDFGALWAWSAFPYESYNFVLRNMLHSSQAILHQICKAYFRFQIVKNCDTFQKQNCSYEGKSLYLKMLGNYRTRTGYKTIDDEHLIIFGNGKPEAFMNIVEKLSIQTLLGEQIQHHSISYYRFIFNNVLYHSTNYAKLCKRENSIVKTAHGNYLKIEKLMKITTINDVQKYVVVGKSFNVLSRVLCTNYDISSARFSDSVCLTDRTMSCLPQDICSKCILLSSTNDDDLYVMNLVNQLETD